MFNAAEKTGIPHTEETRHGLGGNNPPSDIDAFGQQILERYPEDFSKAKRLLEAEERLPAEVSDDETSGKLGDFIKQVKTAYKGLENIRSAEKEVYLEGGRKVDGFFKKHTDKLKSLVAKAEAVNAAYLQKKKDEEKRRLEEEAEKKRLEAEAQIREAQRKQREAEEKRKEAEAAERKAREEAEQREREIRAKAEEERKAKQAEIDRLEKEKADAEADRKAAKAKEDADAAELVAAKEREAALKKKLADAEKELKAVDKAEKAELKEVRADVAEIEDAALELSRQARQDQKESDKLLDAAVRTEKQADKFDKLSEASAADLARTRGDQGSLSTIRTEWVGTITNREKLDKEALWAHLKLEDIQIALNAWVKANPGKEMLGAFIRQETKAITR